MTVSPSGMVAGADAIENVAPVWVSRFSPLFAIHHHTTRCHYLLFDDVLVVLLAHRSRKL